MRRRERQLPVRRNLELLATVHETAGSSAPAPARKVFGNIIELGSRGLILETRNEIRVGAAITLRVVFPGQPRGDDPFTRMKCVVRKVLDEPKLHFDLEIVGLDDQGRERLDLFLCQADSRWGS